MNTTQFNLFFNEIASFADDANDVLRDHGGRIVFERLNQVYTITLSERENGAVFVDDGKDTLPYRNFLQKLAGLDTFAHKLVLKHDKEDFYYVDPEAIQINMNGRKECSAKIALGEECEKNKAFGTTICFITADAGHGKTILLKEYEKEQANSFMKGCTDKLFWHIDLHGRSLVRLNEVLMYELGELRINGLYYNTIITLIKHGLIVLGIDGFDELSAEIGGDKALGSLSKLVLDLDGAGTIIAASRRAFFNTQDYINNSKLTGAISEGAECEFDEIKIKNWGRKQCLEFLSYFYSIQESQNQYKCFVSLLSNGEKHPIIARPFLFTKIVIDSYKEKKKPSDYISVGKYNADGIHNVLSAFVHREVIKWADVDRTTGQPLLSFEQHMQFLAEVAKEMWSEKKDWLNQETIQFLLAVLLESWEIDASRVPQIAEMTRFHALLIVSEKGDDCRCFDHVEFKNYFLAFALKRELGEITDQSVRRFESLLVDAQLPDSVAYYLSTFIPQEKKRSLIDFIIQAGKDDWGLTYLRQNLGTILPFLLNELHNDQVIHITKKLAFSSLVFENKSIMNISFKECLFSRVSLNHTRLANISFDNCTFTDIRLYKNANNEFSNVVINSSCTISKVSIVDADSEEEYAEYSPNNINYLLHREGITYKNEAVQDVNPTRNELFRKQVKRFLNKFVKYSIQYEKNFSEPDYLKGISATTILEEIIPLLEKFLIVEEVKNKNTSFLSSRAWILKGYDIEDVFSGEEDKKSVLYPFWQEVYAHRTKE